MRRWFLWERTAIMSHMRTPASSREPDCLILRKVEQQFVNLADGRSGRETASGRGHILACFMQMTVCTIMTSQRFTALRWIVKGMRLTNERSSRRIPQMATFMAVHFVRERCCILSIRIPIYQRRRQF